MLVMPAPVAGIHVLNPRRNKDVDGRDKPGHDDSVKSHPLQNLPVWAEREPGSILLP
jgi:hypothetical protein